MHTRPESVVQGQPDGLSQNAAPSSPASSRCFKSPKRESMSPRLPDCRRVLKLCDCRRVSRESPGPPVPGVNASSWDAVGCTWSARSFSREGSLSLQCECLRVRPRVLAVCQPIEPFLTKQLDADRVGLSPMARRSPRRAEPHLAGPSHAVPRHTVPNRDEPRLAVPCWVGPCRARPCQTASLCAERCSAGSSGAERCTAQHTGRGGH